MSYTIKGFPHTSHHLSLWCLCFRFTGALYLLVHRNVYISIQANNQFVPQNRSYLNTNAARLPCYIRNSYKKEKRKKKTVLFKLFLNAIQKGPQIFIQIITAT